MFLHQLLQSCDLLHRCMSRSHSLSRACTIMFCPLRSVSNGFWSNFQRDVCWFWSGAGRFVLKLLDMVLRSNLGTSAREFISFSQVENLPDLTVGALTAPTALHGKSSIKPFCLVWHSSVFTTGLFPGGPSYLSFPKACPATVVCCLGSRVLWPVSCTRVALVFTWPVSCTLRAFSPLVTASSCSNWNAVCLCVPCYTFLGMRWVWHLETL